MSLACHWIDWPFIIAKRCGRSLCIQVQDSDKTGDLEAGARVGGGEEPLIRQVKPLFFFLSCVIFDFNILETYDAYKRQEEQTHCREGLLDRTQISKRSDRI